MQASEELRGGLDPMEPVEDDEVEEARLGDGDEEDEGEDLMENMEQCVVLSRTCGAGRGCCCPHCACHIAWPTVLAPPQPRRDYRANSQLDGYEEEGLDEDPEEVLDLDDLLAARRAADRELTRRDRQRGVRGRAGLPAALAGA
jgi:hypothetical protein